MQQPANFGGDAQGSRQSHQILIIDDNVQLRSLLARHILLSCNNHAYSSALYHLGERSEPRLTYYANPLRPEQFEPGTTSPEFMIYEAGSPRHALQWLEKAGIKRLTIISDVMMPVDTEVGLPGLLTGLQIMQVAVNLIFMSSEPQNINQVQILLNDRRAFFLIKGSDSWSRLPDAIVKGVNNFNYQLLPRQVYANPAIFQPPPEPEKFVPDERRRFETIRNIGGIQVRTVSKQPSTVNNTAAAASVETPPAKAPGLFSRLFGRR